MSYVEKVVRFGPSSGLVGILTEPGPGVARAVDAPAVLFWNVGINHHVGPFRFYVDLARRLAAQGFVSLRFDISGLGDSEFGKDDTRSDSERGVGDVQDAMVAVEKVLGIARFVLIGFCSSVDPAHALALADERVAGVVYLEAYSFPTTGYFLRYPLRFLDTNRWARVLHGKFPHWFGSTEEPLPERETVFVRDYPTPERFGRELRTLVERGAKLLLIYVAGDSKYEYREQLFEFTGDPELARQVELEFWPDADHTFYLLDDRRRAVERVTRFMRSHFGPSGATPSRGATTDDASVAGTSDGNSTKNRSSEPPRNGAAV